MGGGIETAMVWAGVGVGHLGPGADGSRDCAADCGPGLCRRLLAGGAPSLHFYTLNLAKPTLNVLARLD